MPGSEHKQLDKPGSAKVVKKKAVRGSAKKVRSLGELVGKKRSAKVVPPSLFLFTLHFLYKNLYILGITLLRRRLRYTRRLKRSFSRARGSIYALLHRMGLAFRRINGNIIRRIRAPFKRIGDTYRQQRPVIEAQRRRGESTTRAYLPVAEAVARLILKIVRTIFNYTAPVVALWFLLVTVDRQLNQPIGLLLEYNGQEIGYIQNEGTFESATQIVRDRSDIQSAQEFAIETPLFKLQEMRPWDSFIKATDIADMIFRTSDGDIQEAYGVYIDNRRLGAVTDKDAILEELDAIKAENASGKPNERIEFIKRVEVTPLQLFPSNVVVDAQEIVKELRVNEDEQESYTVEAGDTPTEIAEKVGMPYSELLAMNPTIEDELMPGMELLTQVARPFMSVKSIFTDVYDEEIPYEVEETQNAIYAQSYREVTQDGVPGLQTVTAEITTINGIETDRLVLDTTVLRTPVPEKVTVGVYKAPAATGPTTPSTAVDTTPSTNSVSSSGFMWPTVSGRATTYRGHSGNGIDIAPGGGGHPIYASAGGTVVLVQAGWVGYGHQIVIDHGNGYRTRYAHLSSIYVSVGDQVAQGQVIGLMGATGWASGNHLHFEVMYNGRAMSPTDYVGSYG